MVYMKQLMTSTVRSRTTTYTEVTQTEGISTHELSIVLISFALAFVLCMAHWLAGRRRRRNVVVATSTRREIDMHVVTSGHMMASGNILLSPAQLAHSNEYMPSAPPPPYELLFNEVDERRKVDSGTPPPAYFLG
jgi:hypothetical protein